MRALPSRPAIAAALLTLSVVTAASHPVSAGRDAIVNPGTPVRVAGSFDAELPFDITFDGSAVWYSDYQAGTVVKRDADDGALLATLNIGGGPENVIYDGVGSIWVNQATGNSVSKIDAATGTLIGTYPVPADPRDVVYDGTFLWVLQGDGLTKLDHGTGEVIDSYEGLTQGAFDVVVAAGHLWLSSELGFVEFDQDQGLVAGVYHYPMLGQMVFDGSLIWFVDGLGGLVRAIDPVSKELVHVLASPAAWGITFDGSSLWVATIGGSILRVNPIDGQYIGSYSSNNMFHRLVSDGNEIWLTSVNPAQVVEFSLI